MSVVLAPCNGAAAAFALAQAGAEELYTGFFDPAWDEAFPGASGLNRMSGFGREANALPFEELLRLPEALARAGRADVKLLCTFNAAAYSSAQLAWIAERYLPRLAEAGFAGVIGSGPELIAPARAAGLAFVASTMAGVYNEDIAQYYFDKGAHRVIVPRDLSLDDVEGVCHALPGRSIEVFLMRNGCVFADSHCLGRHVSGAPSLCRTLRAAPRERLHATAEAAQDVTARAARVEAAREYCGVFHQNTCGLCALWRFEQMGVEAYKVVGRGDAIDDLCTDVRLVARHIEIARACATHEEYLARMERPEGLLDLCANQGLSCYYPEARNGGA